MESRRPLEGVFGHGPGRKARVDPTRDPASESEGSQARDPEEGDLFGHGPGRKARVDSTRDPASESEGSQARDSEAGKEPDRVKRTRMGR